MEDNTMVVFISDNGGYWKPEFIEEFNHRSNYKFRGMKAEIFDGGHSIYGKISWKTKSWQ
ncbi:MAG: hypothetical protein KTR26_05710 [Flammeovirgaceae bacterium]|nr:hypothetical protein [Flammeovirgaceae bacterium]